MTQPVGHVMKMGASSEALTLVATAKCLIQKMNEKQKKKRGKTKRDTLNYKAIYGDKNKKMKKENPENFEEEISYCLGCNCMTKTIKGKCGKCKMTKERGILKIINREMDILISSAKCHEIENKFLNIIKEHKNSIEWQIKQSIESLKEELKEEIKFNKGAELDKQIYKEGESTWGCKQGVLDVEDVKDFISRIQENTFYIGEDLFVRLDFIEKIAGGKLK